jgi:hypothetical protein
LPQPALVPRVALSTAVEGIGHLLSDRLLSIPDYQRAYSWTLDEVEELWLDLDKAIEQQAQEYFLGSIVTTAGGGRRQQVIDGQQRLATATLLYAAMRDMFRARSDERAGDIERDLLGKKNMRTRELEPRLILNAEDNAVFQAIIGGNGGAVHPTQASHRRMMEAFAYFGDRIEKLVAGRSADDWQAPLVALHDFVLEKALVIDVNVADESRAFIIFETLNDRGLNLSTSDLLKNHLLGSSRDRIEEAKLYWARAMAPFASGGENSDSDSFLRHYWASKKGVVRVKALYSQMRDEITSPDTAVRFAKDLSGAGPLWAAMYDRDAEHWRTFSRRSVSALETLKNLKVEQCRPLLLAGLRSLPKHEVERLLTLVIGWSIRWFVVGGGSAGVTERLYADTARLVTDGIITSVGDVTDQIAPRVPNDRDFQLAFEQLSVRRGWLARYYLLELELACSGELEPELVPNQNAEEVNLEHVLPRNAVSSEWPLFSQDELADAVLLLGNQCLLRKSENNSLGNASFEVKKPVLAKSSLSLTAEIGGCNEWSVDAIRNRQERLAELAIGVWRRR